MEIYRIQNEDTQELAKLWMEVFNSSPWNDCWSIESSKDRLLIQINNPNFLGYKICDPSNLCGFVIARFEGLPEGKGIFIDDLCVSLKWQKNGFGKRLIEEIEKYAVENGIRMIITTTAKSLPSYEFYIGHGYIDNQTTVGLFKIVK